MRVMNIIVEFFNNLGAAQLGLMILAFGYVAVSPFFPRLSIENLGQAGKNNIWSARVDPNAPYRAAHMAQEWKEARMKYPPWIGIWVRFSSSGKRYVELMGHECEVQAVMILYNVDQDEYRREEAQRMKDLYSIFHKWDAEKIIKKMKKRSGKANRWVYKRKKRLADFKEESELD